MPNWSAISYHSAESRIPLDVRERASTIEHNSVPLPLPACSRTLPRSAPGSSSIITSVASVPSSGHNRLPRLEILKLASEGSNIIPGVSRALSYSVRPWMVISCAEQPANRCLPTLDLTLQSGDTAVPACGRHGVSNHGDNGTTSGDGGGGMGGSCVWSGQWSGRRACGG